MPPLMRGKLINTVDSLVHEEKNIAQYLEKEYDMYIHKKKSILRIDTSC